MAEILSQNEIDALLSAVSTGDVETEKTEAVNAESKPDVGEIPAEAPPELVSTRKKADSQWMAYDLTSQEKFVRSKLAALEGINERFCRLFRITLSDVLKKNVSVVYKSTEYLRFGDFLTSVLLPSSINMINMSNPSGYMIYVVGSKLTYALLDAYYGGTERGFSKVGNRDEFTQIEQNMIRKIVDLAIGDMQEAWKLNYPIRFEYGSTESNPHFVGAIHGSETVAVVNFEIEFEQLSGPFIVVLQLRALDPIRQFLSVNITQEVSKNASVWHRHWQEEIRGTKVPVRVKLGQLKKSLRDVKEFKKGDVLMLDQSAAEPLTIFVQDLPKFEGMMGVYRGSTAIRITKLFENQKKES